MLFRFSLYGFLKNQRYYDPFLYLVFIEKGLSYFEIGILIGFREICTNLFEIPSGAVADLYGRRRAMIFSFCAYIVSFAIFAESTSLFLLFAAMFFFGLGDAFRSGTHKAIIFDWLRQQGRSDEKNENIRVHPILVTDGIRCFCSYCRWSRLLPWQFHRYLLVLDYPLCNEYRQLLRLPSTFRW